MARSQNRLSNIIVNCRQHFEATKFARQSMNRKTCAIIVQGTKNQHGEKIDPGDATPRLPFSKGSTSCRSCLPGILYCSICPVSSQVGGSWVLVSIVPITSIIARLRLPITLPFGGSSRVCMALILTVHSLLRC